MRCIKCSKTSNEVGVLHRTSPLGESPANWMCVKCMKEKEPELLQNINEDTELVDLINILRQ